MIKELQEKLDAVKDVKVAHDPVAALAHRRWHLWHHRLLFGLLMMMLMLSGSLLVMLLLLMLRQLKLI